MLRFVQTCAACPEQYSVLLGEETVGYVRLRWGTLRVQVPDVGGKTIYQASIGDGLTGCFFDPGERAEHLSAIAMAIIQDRDGIDVEDVEFEYMIEH